jgi:hypothetical protein
MEEMDPKDLHAHVINGMGGLIMGLQILPSGKNWKLEKFEKIKERKLTLIVKEKPTGVILPQEMDLFYWKEIKRR